jgi:hypothetical protein
VTGAEPIWIEELDILTLHDRLLALARGNWPHMATAST